MFLLHSRDWKKSSTNLNFFDDVKVNKTQRISIKIHSELDSLFGFWCKLQNLLWNYANRRKRCFMENSYAMFQIREAVGRSQMFFKIAKWVQTSQLGRIAHRPWDFDHGNIQDTIISGDEVKNYLTSKLLLFTSRPFKRLD